MTGTEALAAALEAHYVDAIDPTRSAETITELLADLGFAVVETPPNHQP